VKQRRVVPALEHIEHDEERHVVDTKDSQKLPCGVLCGFHPLSGSFIAPIIRSAVSWWFVYDL
jgi:hypothetical protein